VEFLRFTRRQIVEMAMLLDIPSQFGDGYEANPTTALSLVLFRLSWPKRLKDIMSLFGHERGLAEDRGDRLRGPGSRRLPAGGDRRIKEDRCIHGILCTRSAAVIALLFCYVKLPVTET
jgi:hypothetical protein